MHLVPLPGQEQSKGNVITTYSTVSGTITNIRAIIIITFGTTSVVMHNDITSSTGISVGSHDCNIVTMLLYQDIVTFSALPKW